MQHPNDSIAVEKYFISRRLPSLDAEDEYMRNKFSSMSFNSHSLFKQVIDPSQRRHSIAHIIEPDYSYTENMRYSEEMRRDHRMLIEEESMTRRSSLSSISSFSSLDKGRYARSPELRTSHKMAERKRRQEMKELFDELRMILSAEKSLKTSRWEILSQSIDHIGNLRSRIYSKENELEQLRHEIEQLKNHIT
ncbi:unnamed protein product [Rhizopus stolonifer]